MQVFDYENPECEKERGRRGFALARRIVGRSTLILIGATILLIGALFIREEIAERAFYRNADNAMGKTPKQVFALLGAPLYDSNNDPPGYRPRQPNRAMLFQMKLHGPYCEIVFMNGVAKYITHYGSYDPLPQD